MNNYVIMFWMHQPVEATKSNFNFLKGELMKILKDEENKVEIVNKVEETDLVDNDKTISDLRSYSFMGGTYSF
jgi:hypothetical protein